MYYRRKSLRYHGTITCKPRGCAFPHRRSHEEALVTGRRRQYSTVRAELSVSLQATITRSQQVPFMRNTRRSNRVFIPHRDPSDGIGPLLESAYRGLRSGPTGLRPTGGDLAFLRGLPALSSLTGDALALAIRRGSGRSRATRSASVDRRLFAYHASGKHELARCSPRP